MKAKWREIKLKLKYYWDAIKAKLKSGRNKLFLLAFILFAPLFVVALYIAYRTLWLATHTDVVSGFGFAALIAAILGAPFIIWRSWVAHQDYRIKEQGHITDRINKAVEGLGAEKTVKQVGKDGKTSEFTQPNLEVRIGSIYALERIAQDSLRDHIQIMEILCAYIRENAPASKALTDEELHDNPFISPRTDIQVGLTVIGRRSDKQVAIESIKGYELDLSSVSLQGASIIGTFNKTLFWGSNFQTALFDGNFDHANFSEAILSEATLCGMEFCDTNFIGSKLCFADLKGATFRNIHFTKTDFKSAELNFAAFQNVSFRLFSKAEVYNLTQDQIDSMFGDGSVLHLPKGLSKPNRWPTEKLGDQFDAAYKAWFENQFRSDH